ncbi:hypothetical protein [Sphingopyxis lindanitolerans]|uniref:hypothetical protein n=1 Tax=Sphingopyxis lindanitolerans TaxID=2054227 RepID=UPI0013049BA3|nr:hypothetical protein [Sphingopyxis lindanitolerans]
MFAKLLPVQSLLIAIFAMMAGSGFLSTPMGLRLERAGPEDFAAPTDPNPRTGDQWTSR